MPIEHEMGAGQNPDVGIEILNHGYEGYNEKVNRC